MRILMKEENGKILNMCDEIFNRTEKNTVSDALNVIGEITEETEMEVSNYLKEAKGNDVKISFNSYGGVFTSGLAIYNALKDYPGKTETVNMGISASASAIAALGGDTRSSFDNAFSLFHPAWIQMRGNAVELREGANFLDKLDKSIYNILKSDFNIENAKEFLAEEKLLTADEAQEMGFVNNIIGEADTAMNEYRWMDFDSVKIKELNGRFFVDYNRKEVQ